MNEAQKIQKFAEIMMKFQEEYKSVKLNKSGTVNANSEYAIKCRHVTALEEVGYDIWPLHRLADKMRPQIEAAAKQ